MQVLVMMRRVSGTLLGAALASLVAMSGCGGSSHDSPCTPGMQIACACPGGTSGVQLCAADGSSYGACTCDSGPDAAVGPATCDPVAQTGCAGGQKCTWIRETASPPTGTLGCVPAGAVAVGGACQYGASGAMTGFDDCQAGLTCLAPDTEAAAGRCESICDGAAQGTAAGTCGAAYKCQAYANYFDGASTTLGLCDPTCDPLTQQLDTDGTPACGGPVNGKDFGCYGYPSAGSSPSTFSCAEVLHPTYTSDTLAYDASAGGVSTNSCAPGYLPLLPENTDGAGDPTKVICVALCEPGDTSQNATQNAIGKLGSAHNCPAAGAGSPHECRYWWWLESAGTPISNHSNGLGFCMDYTQYLYDSDGNGTPDTTYPSCTTLSASGHNFSQTATDTQYWGCEAVTSHPTLRTHPAPFRVPGASSRISPTP